MHGRPVSGDALAEETCGRIPRTVFAIEEPAPVGIVRQQNPNRLAECAGEMRDGGVNGDQQIEIGERCGGVGEIVEVAGEIDEIHVDRHVEEIFCGRAFLQRVERRAGNFGESAKLRERNRTLRIARVARAAGPDEADAQASRARRCEMLREFAREVRFRVAGTESEPESK